MRCYAFQSTFKALSKQFQSSFKAVSKRFLCGFCIDSQPRFTQKQPVFQGELTQRHTRKKENSRQARQYAARSRKQVAANGRREPQARRPLPDPLPAGEGELAAADRTWIPVRVPSVFPPWPHNPSFLISPCSPSSCHPCFCQMNHKELNGHKATHNNPEDVILIGSYCQATPVLVESYSGPTAILLGSYRPPTRVLLSPCTSKPGYFPQETRGEHN
jgi:hypothetical protein